MIPVEPSPAPRGGLATLAVLLAVLASLALPPAAEPLEIGGALLRLGRNKAIASSTSNLPSSTAEMVYFAVDTNTSAIHERFMNLAMKEAEVASQNGEVPIGAVVVVERPSTVNLDESGNAQRRIQRHLRGKWPQRHFEVLSRARNAVESDCDASSHAELLALRLAASRVRNWRLVDSTLYSTLEPCPMCLAAAQAFRVSRVVYGAPDLRLGAVKTHIRLLDVARHPYHDTLDAMGGILEDECSDMMRDFFRRRRKENRATRRSTFASDQRADETGFGAGAGHHGVSTETSPRGPSVDVKKRSLRRFRRFFEKLASSLTRSAEAKGRH